MLQQWTRSLSSRWERARKSGWCGMYSSQAIWCNARGDSALAERLSGFTLTWLPLCGPGSMCFHPAHSWGPNTSVQTKATRRQMWELRLGCECPKYTCLVVKPFHYHAIQPQHPLSAKSPLSTIESTVAVSVCVQTSKSYVLLSLWKKNPYQRLFPNVLLRFLFRGYERKPWQATVFHEVSKQGIPSRVWDLWEA